MRLKVRAVTFRCVEEMISVLIGPKKCTLNMAENTKNWGTEYGYRCRLGQKIKPSLALFDTAVCTREGGFCAKAIRTKNA